MTAPKTENVVPLLSEKEAARRHNLKIAERILDLYRGSNRNAHEDLASLSAWAGSPIGAAILKNDAKLALLKGQN
jgi:hypothetical protein